METSIASIKSRPFLWRAGRFLYYKTKTFSEGVLSQFINFWYGNTAGFVQNFGALKELESFRSKFSGHDNIKSLQELPEAQHLKDFGFVILGKTSYPEAISATVQKVKGGFLDASLHAVSPNGATLHLFAAERIPEIQELLSDRIQEVLLSYYGCAFRIHTVRVWRNSHVPGADSERHDVFSNTFHHDNTKVTGVRVFILLTDGVNRKTGAFRFHDSKVSRQLVRSLGYFHRFMQTRSIMTRLTNPKTLQFFEGDAGDCAIVNTQECLHAASIPKAGSFRDMLQFEIYPDEGLVKETARLFSTIPPDLEVLKLKKKKENDTRDIVFL